MRWEEIRAISVRMRRMYWARSGASTPMSFSVATMKGISLAYPETQSIRLIRAVIWG